jgi:LPXTG-site transpeptidase (sortase) family protein
LGGFAQDVAFAQGWSDNFDSYATGATAASSLAAPLFQLPYTWWSPSWQYARVITVSTFANSPIDGYAGYTVRLVLNTTDGTRFLPSCDDLRIVYWNGATNIPLDRVVSNCGNSATEVWFRLQANIAPSSSDSSYVLYYGNPSAGGAPADPRQVYLWWDDFNRPDTVDITTEVAYSKTGGGTWSIVSGQLRNVGAAGDPNKLLIDALGATVADVLMQTKISVTSWVGDSDLGRMGLSCCMISNGEGYAGLFHQDGVSLDLLNDLRSWGTYGTYSWSVGSWYNMAFRVIRPANRLGQIKVWPAGGPEPGSWTVDGNFGGGAARTNGYVGLGGSRQADITLFDDLFIRKIVDPEPALGLSIEHSLAEQNPELTLTKTIVSGDPYSTVGGTVNYSYAVLNSGDVSLPGPVTVTDDKATATCPAVATVGNLDANLDPGESLNCTAAHTVTQADLNAGSVTNLASASAGGITSNSDSETATATQNRRLSLAKSITSGNPYSAVGGTISYSYAVLNSGNISLAGPVTVSDSLVTVICPNVNTVGNLDAFLDPGESLTCTASHTVTQADLNAGSVTNTATATAGGTTSNSSSRTATATQSPALTLTKSITSGNPYSTVGGTISYSYAVLNSGNISLAGPVTVSDSLVTVICPNVNTVGNLDGFLDPGESLTCTASHTVTQADLNAGSVTNLASASAGGITSNSDSETATATQSPELTLTKSITGGSPYSSVGDMILYGYDVRNTGNVALAGPFAVLDDRSTDETCPVVPSLVPGAWITCNASYTIVAGDLTVGSVTNSAFATGLFAGITVTSNTDQATAVAISDPAVTKSANPTTAQVGDTVTFTLVVTNTGAGNADNVTLTDPIPAFLDIVPPVTVVPSIPPGDITIAGNTITVDFGTLAPAATFTVTITTVVNSLGAPPGGTNTATVTTTSADSDPANNASSALITIVTAIGEPAPGTGFAPDQTTILPAQPADLAYADYGDLWIEIPRLGVKLPIVGVPLTENGWDVTWLGSQAGYLNGTAFPTWKGNSVLTSHVTLASGRAGPFRSLKNLRWDDTVIVHYAGQRYVFSVRSTSAVTANDASIFRHEERPWLTLVTCGGYDAKLGEYRYRIAVKAVLTSIETDP